MTSTQDYLRGLGLAVADEGELASSPLRFPDGAAARIELPSSETPEAIEAALDEASLLGIRITRMTQGGGIMMQSDATLRQLAAMAARREFEPCMFIGPRAAWDIGSQVRSKGGAFLTTALRGANGLVYGIEEVRRACEFGLRTFIIADFGLLKVVGQMRAEGVLPPDVFLKASMSIAACNPASVRLTVELGAGSVNVPNDLSIGQLAAIRASVDVPIDVYVEGTDDQGGPVRYYDLPEIVRVAAPVYMKFGIRNSPIVAPTGLHQAQLLNSLSRERARRAHLAVEYLERYLPSHAVALRSSNAAAVGD